VKELENSTIGTNPCRILIGNKCDKPDRVIETSQGEALAQRLDIPYLETSAKDGNNITKMFGVMTETMMAAAQLKSPEAPGPTVHVDTSHSVKVQGKTGCC
jgi:Ras-related protein Rab-8A